MSNINPNAGPTPLYNFRIAPEALWLIANTVIGSVLVSLIANFAGADLDGCTCHNGPSALMESAFGSGATAPSGPSL